jgi:hypothetical protein
LFFKAFFIFWDSLVGEKIALWEKWRRKSMLDDAVPDWSTTEKIPCRRLPYDASLSHY